MSQNLKKKKKNLKILVNFRGTVFQEYKHELLAEPKLT